MAYATHDPTLGEMLFVARNFVMFWLSLYGSGTGKARETPAKREANARTDFAAVDLGASSLAVLAAAPEADGIVGRVVIVLM